MEWKTLSYTQTHTSFQLASYSIRLFPVVYSRSWRHSRDSPSDGMAAGTRWPLMVYTVAFMFLANGLPQAPARLAAQPCRQCLVQKRVLWASHMSEKLAVEGRLRIDCCCIGGAYP